MELRKTVDYALHLYRAFSEYHEGKRVLSTLPLIAEIEVTNACNLRCLFCSRDAIKNHRGLGYMSLRRFETIASKYRNQLFSPMLSMHGEPTLHPQLPEMVKILKQCDVRNVGFTTNGTLLNAELFTRLADAGLDGVEISFEGTTPEDYEQQRVGARFDEVEKNILDACRLKTEHSYNVNIGINIIDNAVTHELLPQFVQHWSGIVDRVDTAKIIDWVGTLDNEQYSKLRNPDSHIHPFSNFKICPAPWFFVGIMWNGWVVPCCHWLHEPFGNIFEQSLEEIWNGPTFIELRDLMATQTRFAHPYCGKCWNGTMRQDSPFFVEPDQHFPFSTHFLMNVLSFLSWSTKRKYKPNRRKR